MENKKNKASSNGESSSYAIAEKCATVINLYEDCLDKNSFLNFRSLNISSLDIRFLMPRMKRDYDQKLIFPSTLSFSFNPNIGHQGLIIILKNLPQSVNSLGLVDCGLDDASCLALIDYVEGTNHLRMLCVEQNNFSINSRKMLEEFRSKNSNLLIDF